MGVFEMQNQTDYHSVSHSSEEGPLAPKTTLVSRNITVMGRRTSVRLEPQMWTALREIAKREQCTIHDICSLISVRKNEKTSLTAAIRVFIMLYFRAATTEEGHKKAGHGNFEFMKQRARLPSQFVSLFAGRKKADLLNGADVSLATLEGDGAYEEALSGL